MKKNELSVLISSVLVITFMVSLPSYSACTKRQKDNLCNVCKSQALNSSECMSSCPICPSSSGVTSPMCVTSSEEVIATSKRLKKSYEVTVKLSPLFTLSSGDTVHNYTLSIDSALGASSFLNLFTYTANYLNKGYQYKGAGRVEPLRIYFELPFLFGQEIHTLSCSAVVSKPEDNSLPLHLGECTSIILDTNGKLSSVPYDLTGY